MTYRDHIEVDSKIHFGKPCIKGTRVPVTDVLELIQEGYSFEKIREDFYPDLNEQDIKACIEYAADIIRSEDIHLLAS